MRKNILFVVVFILIIFVFSGCANNMVDKSDNIENVSACYYLVDSEQDNIDLLAGKEQSNEVSKTAELIYTKLDITPENKIEVESVSFDAKLKSNESNNECNLKIKVYIITPNEEELNEEKTFILEDEITINNNFKTFSVDFETAQTLNDFSKLDDKVINKQYISIEFLNENNEKNSTILFSLNNIILQ